MKRVLFLLPPPDRASDLCAFAESCLSLTPRVSLVTAGVYLDIAGTARLFGGEAGVLDRVERLLSSFNLVAGLIVCDRPEWARPLAAQRRTLVLDKGHGPEALWRLPVNRLVECGDPSRLESGHEERTKIVGFLGKVGLATWGSFARLPEAAVLRRFGRAGSELHAVANGRYSFPLPRFEPRDPLEETIDAEETVSLDGVLFLLRQALVRLEARLVGRRLAAKAVSARLHFDSSPSISHALPLLEPTYASTDLLRLLQEILGRLRGDSPLTRIDIAITDTIPNEPVQFSLFDDTQHRRAEMSKFVARLRGRFGDGSAGFAALTESFLPERSWRVAWPPAPAPPPRPDAPERPLVLYATAREVRPQTSWELHESERVSAEWWRGTAPRRYFVARTPRGERLWIYRDRAGWFAQGAFE